MKKGWKIFWIICAVLAAVGIFLAVAGTALGGLVMLRDDRGEGILRSWLDRFGIRQEVTVMSEIEEVTDGSLVYAEPDGKDVTSYAGIDELEIELTGMGVRVMPYDESGGTAYD